MNATASASESHEPFSRGLRRVTAMDELVRRLMDQTREFLRRRLAGKESDPSTVGNAQCRSDLFVVFKSNILLCEEVDKAVPVDPNLARNMWLNSGTSSPIVWLWSHTYTGRNPMITRSRVSLGFQVHLYPSFSV